MKLYILIALLFIIGCAPTKLSNKSAGDTLELKTTSFSEPLQYKDVAQQFNSDEMLFNNRRFTFKSSRFCL